MIKTKKHKKSLMFCILKELFNSISYFVKDNLMNFSKFLDFALPYLMYIIGKCDGFTNSYLVIGLELFIPFLFCIVTFFMRSYANRIGKGTTIPVPNKRFTEIDEYGEVSIENRRLQELILYIGDLEDWLERKGLM